MNSENTTVRPLVTGAVMFLSALALAQAPAGDAMAQGQPTWQAITPTTLMINGKTADVTMANEADLRGALQSMLPAGVTPQANLGALITQIENRVQSATDEVPGVQGLAGPFGETILKAGRSALDSGGNYATNTQVLVSMSGQIVDYAYNATAKSGRLGVKTFITTTTIPQSGPTRTAVDSYWYKMNLGGQGGGNSGWESIGKNQCAGQLFCDTMDFTPAMRTRIDQLGFQYKLWAKGSGNIVITEVLQKAGNSANYVTIQNNPGRGAKFYSVGADSCVDMLFVNQPPASFPDGFAAPMYCLGRCENPPIINTGL